MAAALHSLCHWCRLLHEIIFSTPSAIGRHLLKECIGENVTLRHHEWQYSLRRMWPATAGMLHISEPELYKSNPVPRGLRHRLFETQLYKSCEIANMHFQCSTPTFSYADLKYADREKNIIAEKPHDHRILITDSHDHRMSQCSTNQMTAWLTMPAITAIGILLLWTNSLYRDPRIMCPSADWIQKHR